MQHLKCLFDLCTEDYTPTFLKEEPYRRDPRIGWFIIDM